MLVGPTQPLLLYLLPSLGTTRNRGTIEPTVHHVGIGTEPEAGPTRFAEVGQTLVRKKLRVGLQGR
jgi:hypothetical protein